MLASTASPGETGAKGTIPSRKSCSKSQNFTRWWRSADSTVIATEAIRVCSHSLPSRSSNRLKQPLMLPLLRIVVSPTHAAFEVASLRLRQSLAMTAIYWAAAGRFLLCSHRPGQHCVDDRYRLVAFRLTHRQGRRKADRVRADGVDDQAFGKAVEGYAFGHVAVEAD